MNIETFNQLLKEKHPDGSAYIPEKKGSRQTAVSVVFAPNGKTYTYNGTIISVASKLDLIPEIDIEAEADKAISFLRDGKPAVIHVQTLDTVNYYLDMPEMIAQEVNRDKDEFGRVVITVEVSKSEWIGE